MSDNRDFRVRVDLIFTSDNEGVARGLFNHAKQQMAKATNINEGTNNEERGFVSLERCGHSLGLDCQEIEREEM